MIINLMQQARLVSAQGFRITPTKSNKKGYIPGFGAENPDYSTPLEFFGNVGELLGMLCGPCPAVGEDMGLLLVDLDGDYSSVPAIRAFLDLLPATLTSHQGRHLFFSVLRTAELGNWADIFKTKATTGAALDLKWAGNLAAERWDWATDTDTEHLADQIAELPSDALATLLAAHAAHDTRTAVIAGGNGPEYLRENGFDPDQVELWAMQWLEATSDSIKLGAPVAKAGGGGDTALLQVFGGLLVGFGLSDDMAATLVEGVYNDRCDPPWDPDALEERIAHKTNETHSCGSESFEELELAHLWRNRETLDVTSVEPPSVEPDWREPPADAAPAPEVPASPKRIHTVSAAAMSEPLPPVPWLCHRLSIAPGRPTVVVGRAGSGKTLAVQDLAVAVASGRSVFGAFPVRQGAVLHIDLDQGRYATTRRYQQIAAGRGLDLAALPLECAFFNFKMTTNAHGQTIVDPKSVRLLLDSARGVALVIVDSLRGVSSGLDENSSDFGEVLQALSWIVDALQQEDPCTTPPTFVVLHHSGKSESNAGGRGSTAIDDRAGAKWIVARGEESDMAVWTQDKTSEFALGRDRPFSTVAVKGDPGGGEGPGTVVLELAPEEATEDNAVVQARWTAAVERAVGAVRRQPGISRTRLATEIGGKKDFALTVIDALETGASECLGEQIWKYGTASVFCYYSAPVEELILTSLREAAKIEATIARETLLPKTVLKDTLKHLAATGAIVEMQIRGESGWMLAPSN